MIRIDLKKTGHGIRFNQKKRETEGSHFNFRSFFFRSFFLKFNVALIVGISIFIFSQPLHDVFSQIPQFITDKINSFLLPSDIQVFDRIKERESSVSPGNEEARQPSVLPTYHKSLPGANQGYPSRSSPSVPSGEEGQGDVAEGLVEEKPTGLLDNWQAPQRSIPLITEKPSAAGEAEVKDLSHEHEIIRPKPEKELEQGEGGKVIPGKEIPPVQEPGTADLQNETKPALADERWKRLSDTALSELKGENFYSIHVSSFKTEGEAQNDWQRWVNLGYTVFIQLTNVPSKGYWYRVYIGRFTGWSSALKFAQRMTQHEHISYAMPVKLKIHELQQTTDEDL